MINVMMNVNIFLMLVFFHLADALTPIIVVPGYTGSRLEASLDKPNVVRKWCKKTAKNYELWLSEKSYNRNYVPCYADNLKMLYNYNLKTYVDNVGVKVTIPGFGSTETIENVNYNPSSEPGQYHYLISYFVKHGYERNKSIRAAPYDWRKAPNYQSLYMKRLKVLIEDTYKMNKNKRVVLVGHSMGCLMLVKFLNEQNSKWKKTYVKSIVTLAGPFGGSVKILPSFISGYIGNVLTWKVPEFRDMFRTLSSIYSFIPSASIWHSTEVLIQTPMQNYSLSNFEQLFLDIEYQNGIRMWKQTNVAALNYSATGVETHCLYGLNGSGVKRFIYDKNFPNADPVDAIMEDGDGTVNERSLAACDHLSKQKEPFYKKVFFGYSHVGMATKEQVHHYIYQVANKE